MKKLLLMLLATVMLLNACTSDEPSATPEEIAQHLLQTGLLPDMKDIAENRLANHNVNPDDAVSFAALEAEVTIYFVQLIIIRAESGKVNQVRDSMREHQTKLKDATFYPQGAEAAASSIVGTKGSIVYLICHQDAKNIEKELLKFIA